MRLFGTACAGYTTLMNKSEKAPAILVLAGLDPSGGAGLTADVQTITAYGVHPLAVATALTVQSLHTVSKVVATPPALLADQVMTTIQDWSIAAVKIGLVPDRDTLICIADLLSRIDAPNVVADPVIKASAGVALSELQDFELFKEVLLPHHPVLTPNKEEMRQLSGDVASGARLLLELGARAVLVTDGDGIPGECVHELFCVDDHREYRQPRLDARFHGTGCTLASALAAELAVGRALPEAAAGALDFTRRTLLNALGHGPVKIPNRSLSPG